MHQAINENVCNIYPSQDLDLPGYLSTANSNISALRFCSTCNIQQIQTDLSGYVPHVKMYHFVPIFDDEAYNNIRTNVHIIRAN